jgi:glycopeptide antibiotics resistance protein
MNTQTFRHQPACAAWSNRIILVAMLGIAYLTLFPFEFHAGAFHAIHDNPFLLGNSGKESFTKDSFDFFLNVLLFVPFGFGIAAQVRKRNGGLLKAFVWALALGAFLSYSVEFMQLYIPERDSGWEDVFSNTTGSVVGFLLFVVLGNPMFEWLSRREKSLRSWFSPRRGAVVLLAYFAIAFGVSALLQRQTRLSDWDPSCILLVGNDASGRAPWAGRVLSLQIWNRALRDETIQQLSAHQSAAREEHGETGLLAWYDFQGPGPFKNQVQDQVQEEGKLQPALSWAGDGSHAADNDTARFGPKSWLSTQVGADSLNREIQRTNQFTVRLICEPDAVDNGFGRIVSLSQSRDNVNFHLRQAGAHLVFYFRNPLSETRSILAWDLPGIFEPGKILDIAAVYDGSDAFLFVDGAPVPRKYRLGPGASLFHTMRFVRTPELGGCVIFYLTLLFLPAGVLLGLTAGYWRADKHFTAWLLLAGSALPAVLLELLLSAQSGRRIWPSNIGLSVAFELAGILLVNSDRLRPNAPGNPVSKLEN